MTTSRLASGWKRAITVPPTPSAAFAVGGTDYAASAEQEITGSATYNGKAAGAHHKTGEGVNWFDGDASLTAEFGEDDEAGTISGAISNIRVNGGAALTDSIVLRQAALTDGSRRIQRCRAYGSRYGRSELTIR